MDRGEGTTDAPDKPKESPRAMGVAQEAPEPPNSSPIKKSMTTFKRKRKKGKGRRLDMTGDHRLKNPGRERKKTRALSILSGPPRKGAMSSRKVDTVGARLAGKRW